MGDIIQPSTGSNSVHGKRMSFSQHLPQSQIRETLIKSGINFITPQLSPNCCSRACSTIKITKLNTQYPNFLYRLRQSCGRALSRETWKSQDTNSLILKVESGSSNYSSHLGEKAQETVRGVSPVMSESLNKSQPPTVLGRGLTGFSQALGLG